MRCSRRSRRRSAAPAPTRARRRASPASPTGARRVPRRNDSGPCRRTGRCACAPVSEAASGRLSRRVLRKLMRWYVEPLAYDQRSFNAAALRLVDDLENRVAALEAELARLRAADPSR